MEERDLEHRKMKILVAVDGSENSQRALEEAKIYGAALGAEIKILTVLEHISPHHYSISGKERAQIHEQREAEANQILAESLKTFEDYPEKVTPLLKQGEPANQILETIEGTDFNLVIMGNRGLGAFSRTLLGSVSNKVLNHSHTNILIVR